MLTGQSLGALAALHAAWTSPATFAGLLLQSGSFFTPELDPQEADFESWDEVTGFVASRAGRHPGRAGCPPVAMTCGTAEENVANNRLLRDHLRRARPRRDVGRGPAGPHLDLLARPARPAPHRPAAKGVELMDA